MKVPTKSKLIHLKIQAAMRENNFEESQMKYLGYDEDRDDYIYLIAGEHKVSASQIEEFELDG